MLQMLWFCQFSPTRRKRDKQPPGPALVSAADARLYLILVMTARSGSTLETDVSQILQAAESPARRHHGPSDPQDAPALIVTVGLPGHGKCDVTKRRLELRNLNHDPDDRSTAGLRVYGLMAATAEKSSRACLRIDTSDAIDREAALRSVVEACEPLRARSGKDGRHH